VSRRRILLRPAAERDLEQQAQYIASSLGLDMARRFYRAAEQTVGSSLGSQVSGGLFHTATRFLPRPGCFG
jgi:plasmid stabilization system protein ParE